MNRLLALLMMFAFTVFVAAPTQAQDDKKPEVKKEDETKKEETKKEETKGETKTETKVTAKEAKPAAKGPHGESAWEARARVVGNWWPLISLVLFGGLFFLIVRLRSDLTTLQEKVQG